MKVCLYVGLSQRAITFQCGSKNTMRLAYNPNFHAKTKHIDIQYLLGHRRGSKGGTRES